MKWYAITGSWKIVSEKVVYDVQEIVNSIIGNGDGIVAGGALGVDYIATQVVLEKGDVTKQIRIYLPIPFADFCNHYWKRADEGIITHQQAEMITNQLKKIHELNPKAIFDITNYKEANKESYFARNTTIVKNCDSVFAFQVNESEGVADAVSKARELGKQVVIKKYTIY